MVHTPNFFLHAHNTLLLLLLLLPLLLQAASFCFVILLKQFLEGILQHAFWN